MLDTHINATADRIDPADADQLLDALATITDPTLALDIVAEAAWLASTARTEAGGSVIARRRRLAPWLGTSAHDDQTEAPNRPDATTTHRH